MRWIPIILALAGCTTTGARLEHPAPRGHAPTVPVTVSEISRASLPNTCQLEPGHLVGCSLLWPGQRCEIYLADDLRGALRREVLAHERAHCGGWAHGD